MAVHVINEANRCLNCKKPMCMQGCPIHTPIPMMIKAFKEGNLNEAGEMLFENNPMSMICSLVCNHENQCEGHCVLGRKGSRCISAALRIMFPILILIKCRFRASRRMARRLL
ncbi:MAG: hypothetical protein ACLUD2_08745 [Clostridium sp.]